MTETPLRSPNTVSAAWGVWSLLVGVGLIMLGNGLQSSLLGVRASAEGFGNTLTGLIMSAYFLGFLAGATMTPRGLRSVGHIRVFAALASVTSVAILAHAMFVVPWVWAVMRFVTGFAYAGLYVVSESWLNGYTANYLRGRLLGIYMVISYLGMGGGQLLLNVADPGDAAPFVLVSVLMSLALVPMLLSATPQPDTSHPEAMGLARLYRLSALGTVGCFATGISCGAIFGMGAVFADRSGMPLSQVAAFMSAFIFGGALLQWPLGKLSDLVDRQWVIVGVALIAAALAFGGLFVHADQRFVMILLGVALGGTTLTLYSLCLASANDFLTSAQTVAASSSLVFALGLGAILGPIGAGYLMDLMGPSGFLWDLAAIHVAIAVFGGYCLVRYPTSASEEHGHYVAAASGAATLGEAWTEEASSEPVQLELLAD